MSLPGTRRTVATAVALVVALVLAAGVRVALRDGADRDDAAPAPPSTRPLGRPPTVSDAPASKPSPSRSTAGAPTAAPTGPALVGHAQVEDATGDVLDDTGARVDGAHPAADLVAVVLDGDGARLRVRWELAAAPPARHEALLWALDLWDGERRVYSVTVQQVGAQRVAGVLDWSTSAQERLDPPRVDGTALVIDVPAALLRDLPAVFVWSALAQVDLAYEDTVPGAEGQVHVPTAPFPQQATQPSDRDGAAEAPPT